MNDDLKNIKAEVLLNYLYPEKCNSWVVENMGTFFRNYQSDLIHLDVENNKLSLSRDNFIKLLPESMISGRKIQNKKKAKYNKNKQTKEDRRNYEDLCAVFSAIDTFRFRSSLEYEAFFSSLSKEKTAMLLKEIYGYDYAKEENEYVKEMAPMILNGRIKGDMELIREMLESLLSKDLNCRVQKEFGEYKENGRCDCLISQVSYYIIISGLNEEDYKQMTQRLAPLFDFIKEWFVPVWLRAEFIIRDNTDNDNFSHRGLLGYNTKIQLKNNTL